MTTVRALLALVAAGMLACTLGATPLEAQTGTMDGRVVDAKTGAALAGVHIAVSGTDLRALSTSDGRFSLVVPAGTHTVTAQMIGYGPAAREILVRRGITVRLSIELSQGVTTLEPVSVIGERGGYVVDQAATATKTNTPLIETPQSVTVITAVQIRDQASPTLQETVRYTAGVRNELYGIDNRGDWISLRGSGEPTTLLDGVREPLVGSWGVVRTEPYAYERIEVLRGPSSIIAGQNDPGGVVNMVSKRPRTQAARELGLTFGNRDQKELTADLTGPLNTNGALSYRLLVLGKDGGTQIQHADEQRLLVAPSLTWRWNAKSAVTFFGEHQYDRSKNTNAFLGLEGTLEPAPNGPIPTDLFIGEPGWDRYGGTRWRGGYAVELGLGKGWQVRHNLRHDRVDGLLKTMYAAWWNGFVDESGTADPGGRYLGRYWYANTDLSRVTTGDLLLQGRLHTGAVAHTLLFGVDGGLHDASQASAEDLATPLNVYDPAYGSDPEPSLNGAPTTDTKIRRLGLLVQEQMKLFDRLSVRAGLRRDFVRNTMVGGDTAKDQATSANVGMVYEVLPGLAPYASYSESFNPVSGTDAAGDVFKPKRGGQIEAGVKWQARSHPVQAAASVFSLKERNRLASDPDNFGYSVQIGEARIKGLELEASGALASWLVLGSYTLTHARASANAWGGDLDSNQQLEGIPEHMASLWAVHDLRHLGLRGLSLGGGVRYVGRVGDGTGAVFVPAVTLFDARASCDVGAWRVTLNFNNLTDKSYIATCLARGDCWFGSRRRIVSTLTYRW